MSIDRFALLLGGLLLLAGSLAQAEPLRSITVQAEGVVEAIPDTIDLSVEVRYTRESMDEASRLADDTVDAIIEAARDADIEKEDIDSSQMSAFPEYRWEKQERKYMGETVQRTVRLKIRDLDEYGELIGDLSKLDLHRLSPPSLGHSKLEKLKMKALQNALDRGTRKARLIADQVGEDLGDVITVTEGASHTPAPRMMMAEAARADSQSSPSFNLGKTRITASVTMTFEID